MKSIGHSGRADRKEVDMLPRVPSAPYKRLRSGWRDTLRKLISAHPVYGSMRSLSLAAGLNHSAVSEWLRDKPGYKQKEPSFDALAAVAKLLGVSLDIFVEEQDDGGMSDITPVAIQTATVVGSIEAGAWRDPQMLDLADKTAIGYVPDTRYVGLKQFAWKVAGSSINRIASDGDYVITVRFIDLEREPADNDLVICERHKHGTVEYTAKRVRRLPRGRVQLVPDSTDKRFQTPLWLSTDETDDVEVTATHLIIGVFRPVG
jgi:transcriptional regulator with XRE-family HTH domain